LGGKPGAHRGAAVGGQAVPQQRGLLPAQEPPQLTENLDQAIGVVVAERDVEGQVRRTLGGQAERGLVEEDQTGFARLGEAA